MATAQDWCLECGAGAPGGLGTRPGWRAASTIIALTVVLAAVAVAAAYAALSSSSRRIVTRPAAVAAAPPATTPATTPPAATAPTSPTPPASTTPPAGTATPKPPKIPAATPTPTATTPAATTPAATPKPTTTHTTTTPAATAPSGAQPGSPFLLDPDATSTYDPYNYATSEFGDPSLAIDGDPTTSWTAQANPGDAPRFAAGLLVDLKSSQRLNTLKLLTDTPGMRVELYGANGANPPPSITDPAWIHLGSVPALKHSQAIRLKTNGTPFRWIAVWITHASAKSPSAVDIAELSLTH